jgi:importin subunit beta-1
MEAFSRMPRGSGLTSPDEKENSTLNKMNMQWSYCRVKSARALKATSTNGMGHDKLVELGAKPQKLLARNLLLASQDTDSAVRKAALSALISPEEINLAKFLVALVDLLASARENKLVRQLAGLQMKNLLVATDDALQTKRHEKWKAIPLIMRKAIISNLFHAICSPVWGARTTASQVCSVIAAIELPYNDWPEFSLFMLESVKREGVDEGIKISCLDCISKMFCCLACKMDTSADRPKIPQQVTNLMLTTILDGMHSDRPDPVRCAATKALGNSLAFTEMSMENSTERGMIIKAICEATKGRDVDTRATAHGCIVQIIFYYYEMIPSYMPMLFSLIFAAIHSDEEKVSLQAIESLSTLSVKEKEMNHMAAELTKVGQRPPPGSVCFGFVKAELKYLGALLIETLLKLQKP